MINREKVIRHINAEISIAKTCKKDFASVDFDMLSDALTLLKEQESVIEILKSDLYETLAVFGEQAEIVLCKDCKRKDTLSCPKAPVRPNDWFCADGKRK